MVISAAVTSLTRLSWAWAAQDALNETVRNRVGEADLAAADAVLRAVFPDDSARQRVDERLPPPTGSP